MSVCVVHSADVGLLRDVDGIPDLFINDCFYLECPIHTDDCFCVQIDNSCSFQTLAMQLHLSTVVTISCSYLSPLGRKSFLI